MSEHTPEAAAGHGRRQYLVIFVVLFIFTIIEVAVALPQFGIPRVPKVTALVLLAITKASLVGLYFMHLKTELRGLKLTVVIPFFFPALYAFVLIAEASWRLLR